MMKLIMTILMTMMNFIPQAPSLEVTIDRIEDNNIVVAEVCYNNKAFTVDVPEEDFNHQVAEGEKISASAIKGSFEWLDGNDWFQFKSYDDTVWWALTTEDIGFVPIEGKIYTLIYYDNGTTDCTECDDIYKCECEVYDDIFLGIIE